MDKEIESSEEIKILQEKIESLEGLLDTAVFNTYRNILPAFDDLNRAKDNIDNVKDLDSLKEGLKLVSHNLIRAFEALGISEMNVKVGDTFNPDEHDAIACDETEEEGKIVGIYSKGYLYYDKIIRCPQVVVGSKKK